MKKLELPSNTTNGHYSRIERNRLLYLIANVGGHVYVLLTLPILTRFLTPDEFGFYTILVQIVTITQAASLVLFSSALLRFYVDYEGQERRRFLGTIVWTCLVIQILAASALYAWRYRWLPVAFPNITIPIDPYVLYAMVWMVLISLRALCLSFIKILEQPKLILYQILTFGAALIPMLYLMVVVESRGLRGALESLVTAESVSLLILILRLRAHVALNWSFVYLKRIVVFSAPLVLSSMLFIVFVNVDRIVLSRYVSLADLGVYGIGFLVGNIAALVVTANNSSYSPRMLKVMKAEGDEAARRISGYFITDTLKLVGLAVAVLTISSDAITFFLGGESALQEASIVVIGIASGHLARSQYLVYWQSLFSKNRTGAIFLLNILLLGVGLGVANTLAWGVGMQGVAFMSLISHMAILPIAYFLTKQNFYIPINIRATLETFLFVAFLVMLELYLGHVGRSFVSLQFWLVKLTEIVVTLAIYGNYCISICRKCLGRL